MTKKPALKATVSKEELTVHAVGSPANIIAYAIVIVAIAFVLAQWRDAAKIRASYDTSTTTTTKTKTRTRISIGEK